MNEKQLEQIVHHQRVQMFFMHSAWLNQREQNLQLREHIRELQLQLERAGIDYVATPPTEHPLFSFMTEIATTSHA